MDPLSIVTASFSLASGIAKASLSLSQFARDVRDSADDLDAISKEMQSLAAVLDPLTRSMARRRDGPLPEVLVLQVDTTITGCVVVVEQIEQTIQKYRRDKIWTSAKWVIFGKGDMAKLRESLESYTMALSLGLHATSISTGQDIKDDTEVIRSHVEAVKFNTDEILARVNSLRDKGPSSDSRTRVAQWIEQMTILSSYAESTYKETLVDPAEFATDQGSPVLAAVQEVPEVTERKESSHRPLLEVSRLMQREPDQIELSLPDVIEHEKYSSRLRPKVTERKRSSSRPRREVSRLLEPIPASVKLWRPPSESLDQESPVLAAVQEIPEVTKHKESSHRPLLEVSRLIQREPNQIELSLPDIIEHEKYSSRLRPKVTERKRSSSRPRREVSRLLEPIPASVKLWRPPSESPDPIIPGTWNTPRHEARVVKEMVHRESSHSAPGTNSPSPNKSHASSPMPEEKLPDTDNTEAWSRLSFKGIEDFAEEVKEVALLVRRDEELIAASLARRKRMDYQDRKTIDRRMHDIGMNTSAKFVRDVVAEGADPSSPVDHLRSCRTLAHALQTVNNECLFALLKYGVNPNARVALYDYPGNVDHTALAYAAWAGNERAVWALCAAGASVGRPGGRFCCPQCAGQHILNIYFCPTPLLRAVGPRKGCKGYIENSNFARIVRFLLANGADPNDVGCDEVGPYHLLNPPLSAALVYQNLSDEKAAFLIKSLIEAGAKIQFNHLSVRSYLTYEFNPIATALRSGNSEILRMIAPGVKDANPAQWKHVIVDIPSGKESDTILILMHKPYFQVGYLHYVVLTYMDVQRMTWSRFCLLTRLLIKNGANPREVVSVTYTKRHFLKNRTVTEQVSAMELAERIHTKMPRRDVIDLLHGYDRFPPRSSSPN